MIEVHVFSLLEEGHEVASVALSGDDGRKEVHNLRMRTERVNERPTDANPWGWSITTHRLDDPEQHAALIEVMEQEAT